MLFCKIEKKIDFSKLILHFPLIQKQKQKQEKFKKWSDIIKFNFFSFARMNYKGESPTILTPFIFTIKKQKIHAFCVCFNSAFLFFREWISFCVYRSSSWIYSNVVGEKSLKYSCAIHSYFVYSI